MTVKFKINSGCAGCGLCYFQHKEYFKENADGTASVNEGKLLENKSEAEKIASVCPNKVIVVESAGTDKKQAALAAIQKLKNFAGCPLPSKQSISFKKEEYYVDNPGRGSNEGRYDYSSDRAAENAALSDFKNMMFYQVDSIILKIITEYRVKYIKPYYTKSINDGSVYAKTNTEVSKILKQIKNIISDKLPSDFEKVDVFPKEDIAWKMLNNGQLISDDLVSAVKREFDYSPDDYSHKWDTDDMECYAGTNWRGESKYKDMYCYRNLRAAFDELGKDILSSCYYARDSIEGKAYGLIESFVKEYNQKLQELIKQKIALAENALNS